MSKKAITIVSASILVVISAILLINKLYFYLQEMNVSEVIGDVYVVYPGAAGIGELPTVSITTDNDEMPTYSIAEKPADCFGGSITAASCVSGGISVSIKDNVLIEENMKFHIRGNTSAFVKDKRPYKIELQEAQDLLLRGNTIYKNRYWLLLGCENLNEAIGLYVSKLCGMEWEPAFTFVNLEINGEQCGCYYLMESVDVSESRINITENGFLVENDAYWWGEENNYFRTGYQDCRMGYTIKYAEVYSKKKMKTILRDCFELLEENLYLCSSDSFKYLDLDTSVSWALTHDILGTADGAGSNMYLYCNSLSELENGTTTVKMGPVWDYDVICAKENSWSDSHISRDAFFINQCFYSETFLNEYLEKWINISENIVPSVEGYLQCVFEMHGEAIDSCWKIDAERTNKEYQTVSDINTALLQWCANRKEWLDTSVIALCEDNKINEKEFFYFSFNTENAEMSINYYDSGKYDGMLFEVWSGEDGTEDLTVYEAIRKDSNCWIADVYLGNHVVSSRVHIKASYLSDTSQEPTPCNYTQKKIVRYLFEH